MKKKLEVLSEIAALFNQNNIKWVLGASFMMFFRGIDVNVNDIDIRVIESDFNKVKELLIKKARIKEVMPNEQFKTKRFIKLTIDGVNVDIMAGFAIVNNDKVYRFPLIHEQKMDEIKVDNQKVYLDCLDDWATFYKLMNRKDKLHLIKAYLKSQANNL